MNTTGYTFITGATSDIGRQICLTLATAGHCLLLTDISEEVLLETKAKLPYPERHLTLTLDLSEVEQAEQKLSQYIIENNIQVVNVVFAAGIFTVKPLKLLNYAFVKKNFDIALFSIIALSKVLTSKKIHADNLQGMVLISSVSAIMGTKGYTTYSAVKAGMLGLMKSLAVELAPKVRVNAIMPGGVRTKTTNFLYELQENSNPRYLLGDGKKEDIANMVEFLLSDKSRWITGQEFVVDGGLTIN
ncbi:MAG: SDR family oxidoreductase [Bacteroidales bacterium]|nr:SDR family oxidoreductase [Bacteroidales bacterium]